MQETETKGSIYETLGNSYQLTCSHYFIKADDTKRIEKEMIQDRITLVKKHLFSKRNLRIWKLSTNFAPSFAYIFLEVQNEP